MEIINSTSYKTEDIVTVLDQVMQNSEFDSEYWEECKIKTLRISYDSRYGISRSFAKTTTCSRYGALPNSTLIIRMPKPGVVKTEAALLTLAKSIDGSLPDDGNFNYVDASIIQNMIVNLLTALRRNELAHSKLDSASFILRYEKRRKIGQKDTNRLKNLQIRLDNKLRLQETINKDIANLQTEIEACKAKLEKRQLINT